GRTVAVKVQRAGVQETFEADMRNLRRLARLTDRFGLAGVNSIVQIVDELRSFTLREMDFVVEGRTADRLRQGSSPYAYIPRIYRSLTTQRLLTMEYIEGVSLLAICRLAEAGDYRAIGRLIPQVDLGKVIGDLARACLHQLFVTGFFHGDPHPGNILIKPDGTVAFVDFGIFGELTPGEKKLFGDYIKNLAMGNIEESFCCYLRLVNPTHETDLGGYRRETMQILARWYEASKDPDAPMTERHTGKYQGQMVQVMRRYQVRMQPNQLLFWRVMVVLDATALRLPTHFDLISTMHGFFTERRPLIPVELVTDFSNPSRMLTTLSFGRQLPGQALRALNNLTQYQTELRVRNDLSTRRSWGRALDWLLLSLIALPPAILAGGRVGEPGIPLMFSGAAAVLLLVATALGRRH
ncbi:MAG TPA: AarF/ABC1/UbiB kinase family protein, partial [Blastocatellia bacterium]|nr:AarF/ABC1/UbiB kinase family protein [Blastocatellia bacterium]